MIDYGTDLAGYWYAEWQKSQVELLALKDRVAALERLLLDDGK